MIGVSASVREAAGLSAGDPIDVEVVVDTSPREVEIPSGFAVALEEHPTAKAFFATLSNGLQRYHVDAINAAKAENTRQWRIAKSIGLFLETNRAS